MQQQQQPSQGLDFATIRTKLQRMVMENRLQHFYPPQRLDAVAQRVAKQNVANLGRQWRLPWQVLACRTICSHELIIGYQKIKQTI